MATFDVTLPVARPVVFPPRCVVCEAKNPDGMIRLSFLGITQPSFLTMAVDKAFDLDVDPKYYGSNTTNEIAGIPACKRCASKLKWYHRLLKLGYYTAWIPGLIPILFLHTPRVINIAFLIFCAISPGLFTLIFPPSFGATFVDNKANFEFRSKTVAEEFLQLNSDAQLKGGDRT